LTLNSSWMDEFLEIYLHQIEVLEDEVVVDTIPSTFSPHTCHQITSPNPIRDSLEAGYWRIPSRALYLAAIFDEVGGHQDEDIFTRKEKIFDEGCVTA